jgi:hypothetical protein
VFAEECGARTELLEVAVGSEGGRMQRSSLRLLADAVDGYARLDKSSGSALEWT